ncbi:phage tail protein [Streptomyces rochei]|uniref:phage tail protein n=1 Tax=Streptomyces rochei TaxID=1928 RepID=UPI00363C62E9
MALTIGELVGFIRADGTDFERNLARSQLRMEGFSLDVNGRLRDTRGRFVDETALMGRALADSFSDAERAGTRITTVYSSVADAQSRTLRARFNQILTSGRRMTDGLSSLWRRATQDSDQFDLSLGRIAGMAGRLGGVAMSVGRIAGALGAAIPVAAGLATTLANVAPAAAVGVTGMLALKQATFTVKLATQGMDDALSAALDPSKAEEFQEALKGLSPEAREFALAVQDIAPAWRELQQDVQDEFFRDLSEGFARTSKVVLPVLRKELLNTSTALGDMAAGAMGAAKNLAEDGTLGKAMGSASKGLASLSGLPGVVVTALGQLAAAAGPSFERLTSAAMGAANKIGKKLDSAFQSGAMEEAIEGAIDLLGDLWDVGRNVGEIIGDIFGAVPDDGGGLVGILETITGALAEITGTPEFQEGLTSLFETVNKLATTAAPLLAEALALIAPILTELAPHVQDLIEKLGEGLSPILEELKSSGLLTELASGVGEIADSLGPLLPPLGELVASILPLLTPLVRLATEGVKLMGQVIEKWVVPWVQALAALLRGDFSGAWEHATTAVNGARELIGKAAGKISDLVEQAVNEAVRWLKGLPGRAYSALSTLAGFLAQRAAEAGAQLVSMIMRKIAEAIDWLRGVPGRARDALGDLGGILMGAGRALIQGFIDGIVSKIGDVGSAVGSVVGAARDYFPFSPAKKGPFSGRGYTSFSGQALMEDFRKGIASQAPALQRQMDAITSGLQGEFAMAGVPAGAGVGGGRTTTNNYTYNLTQRELTLRDLEALQRRQDTLARVGRPY